MVRKSLKKTTQSEKLKAFIQKYKIPPAYLSGSRKMITRGVVLGLFIAFIPMPMQMAATLLFMPFFRFNVPIAVAMVWITNPFTMPPIYTIEYYTGSFLLNMQVSDVEMTIDWFKENLDDIFIPLYFGAFFYSIISSIGAYFLIPHLWKKSVDRDKKKHHSKR